MPNNEVKTKTNSGRKRIQKYLGSQGIGKDLWWYLRKIYHPEDHAIELVLPNGDSVFYDTHAGAVSDLPALKETEKQRVDGKISMMDSFNTPRFKETLFGGEFIKKLILKTNKKGKHTIEAILSNGVPLKGDSAVVHISAKNGLYYMDALEDEVKAARWVNRLSDLKVEWLRPQIEEMYGDFRDAVSNITAECRSLMNEREDSIIRNVTTWYRYYNQPDIRSSIYRGKKWVFRLEYRGIDFLYHLNDDTLELGNGAQAVLRKISAAGEYTDLYQSRVNEIANRIPDDIAWGCKMKTRKDGEASIQLTLAHKYDPCTISVICSADEEKMAKFYQKMEKKIQELRQVSATKDKELREKLVSCGLYGNVFAIEIIEHTIAANQHETIYSTAASMRNGKPTDFDPGCGQYQMLSSKEIQDFVRHMEKAGVLRLKYSYNAERVWLNDNELCNTILFSSPLHYGIDTEYNQFTDLDWDAFLAQEEIEDKTVEEWVEMTPIFSHKEYCCRRKSSIAGFFSMAPKEVKEYIKTLASLEEDKVIRKIMKEAAEGEEKWGL